LEVPELSSRAAVAWSRVSREAPPEAVTAALHRGLYGTHSDIRLECALCLRDEVEVAQALDSPDAETARFARRVLSQWGSPKLFAKLRKDGDPAFAKEVLRELPTPPPEGALEALLTVSVRTVDAMADELLSFAKRRPFRDWGTDDQRKWARWARAVLRGLPAETALHFFDWAATPPSNDPEAPEEEETEAMWAFLEEAVHAIDRGTAKDRAGCFRDSAFTRFLHHSGVDEQRWLNEWAREPASGEALLEALVMFPSREDRVRPDASRDDTSPGHAGRLLMAVWEGPEQHLLIPPLSKVAHAWSAYSGREKLLEAVWRRFQSHPAERPALLLAFAGWRDRLWELQCQAEPDALVRFQSWWRVDPKGLYPQTEDLLRGTPEGALPRALRALWDAAEELVATRPRTASLSVSKGAMALRNALESRDSSLRDVLDGELEHFEARFPAFERRVLATPSPPEESDIHRDFLDDTHGALRMMEERRERRREEAEREREREITRRVAESRRRDQERQAEDARRAAEAQAAVREQQEVLARVEAQRLLVTLQPRVTPAPVDREVVFPESAFPTLLDYARVIKAMQRGADVMKLFDTLGLTPVTWAAQANAWGQKLVGRMELALRFGELLQAPWE
jgi:cellulose synthase operon protein C